MTKHSWTLWLAPAAVWAVYMCWLTGYQNGYEQGHNAGWETARSSFMPTTASYRPSGESQLVGLPFEARERLEATH